MKRTKREKNSLIDGAKFFVQFVSNLFKFAGIYNLSNEDLYSEIREESFAEKIIKSIVDSGKKIATYLFPGNEYLKLLSGEEEIAINACDGTELISEAIDTFISIDSGFKNYDANEKGTPTEAIKIGVYELVKSSQFTDFFNSVGVDLDKLCLTQHQIKKFVNSHRNWLRTDGYATFFLFKSKGKCFVAEVSFDSVARLGVNVRGLGHDRVWDAGNRRHVVLPQLNVL